MPPYKDDFTGLYKKLPILTAVLHYYLPAFINLNPVQGKLPI